MTATEKEFVLTHVFKNVSSMKDGVYHYSPTEEHFEIPWKICAKRSEGHLGLCFFCEQEKTDWEWSIETWWETKISGPNGKSLTQNFEETFKSINDGCGWGCDEFIKWEDLMKDYVVDDTMRVDVRVKIKSMTGITIAKKRFVLSHVFKNVSSMKDGVYHFSPIEEHFGIPWKICAKRSEGHLGLCFFCEQEKTDREWFIETWRETKISGPNGKTYAENSECTFKSIGNGCRWGWDEFIEWEDLMKDYVVDDTMRVDVRMKIKKMVGIPKKNLRNFDKSTKEFFDIVLMVENQKFYVSKQYLASQSSYFEELFRRSSEKPNNTSEITLQDATAPDFQNFLELLHGENPIDESTIDGLVHLTNKYKCAELAVLKCEVFLMKSSEKSLKEKLKLAHRYNLENVKEDCLSNINTVSDIRSVTTGDTSEMDPSVLGKLMQKLLTLQGK